MSRKLTKTKPTKPKHPWMTTKTIDVIDASKIPTGTYFTSRETSANKRCRGFVENNPKEQFLYFWNKDGIGGRRQGPYGFHYAFGRPYREITSTLFQNWSMTFPTKPKGFTLPKTPLYIGTDRVLFAKGSIVVGCQKISNTVVREIAKKLKD